MELMGKIEVAVKDFVRHQIMVAMKQGDGAMLRWYADRKMRDEGFGHFVATVDETPPDPARQASIQKLIDFYHHETMRRYRAGLGPLLLDLTPEVKR